MSMPCRAPYNAERLYKELVPRLHSRQTDLKLKYQKNWALHQCRRLVMRTGGGEGKAKKPDAENIV